MNTPKLQHFPAKIVQAILNSGRIPYGLRKNSIFSKRGGVKWINIPNRDYTIPAAPGSGVGKGGGAGGTVRESGGALGQYGAAHEEEFFYNKQREQLEKIKTKLKKEERKPPQIQRKDDENK